MVHSFFLGGYNILLDVNSSIVHVVDKLTAEIIELINADIKAGKLKEFSPSPDYDSYVRKLASSADDAELKEVCAEIDELIKAGELYTEDIYQGKLPLVNALQNDIKAMCLHVSHDCNLACKYCFADEGMYKGERGLMSFEVGRKALDFLIKHSGLRRNLEVDFFGGEPLLNFKVVRDLVNYGRSLEGPYNKNFRFTLTTNALLLNDEINEFLNREMSNVVLSIDGRRDVNDRMRLDRKSQGSYDRIVPKIKRFVEMRGKKDYFIRGTFTKYNLDFTEDIKHFLDLGFNNLSIEPVVTDAEYKISEDDLPVIMDEYERLAKFYVKRRKEGKGFTFFHFMVDLDHGPCVIKRLKGCGSGSEYLAVSPAGELYPCHQFVGQKKFLIGDLDKGITRPDICDHFRKSNVYTKDKCESCFAKFFCSGGCPSNSYGSHKDINKVEEISCAMQRKRLECSLMIQAALAERGE